MTSTYVCEDPLERMSNDDTELTSFLNRDDIEQYANVTFDRVVKGPVDYLNTIYGEGRMHSVFSLCQLASLFHPKNKDIIMSTSKQIFTYLNKNHWKYYT